MARGPPGRPAGGTPGPAQRPGWPASPGAPPPTPHPLPRETPGAPPSPGPGNKPSCGGRGAAPPCVRTTGSVSPGTAHWLRAPCLRGSRFPWAVGTAASVPWGRLGTVRGSVVLGVSQSGSSRAGARPVQSRGQCPQGLVKWQAPPSSLLFWTSRCRRPRAPRPRQALGLPRSGLRDVAMLLFNASRSHRLIYEFPRDLCS